ncbi:DUF1476 domain-containing protein [Shimia ponticola]|uniref:DUF1476 domain-containing protein n=1 Tax=Shimia ponticola TaxID=2582893 RepID=UPI0011BDF6AB|nr:DUF1476 domain-containing protein [Shimia ponticola]
MTDMKDRADAFEAKFAHDAEMAFKVAARRNKMLAEWAGGMLQKSEDEMAAYVTEVIKSDFEEAGDEDVIRKLVGDIGHLTDEGGIRQMVADLTIQAKAQVMGEHDS